jgi:hypothetical protein
MPLKGAVSTIACSPQFFWSGIGLVIKNVGQQFDDDILLRNIGIVLKCKGLSGC